MLKSVNPKLPMSDITATSKFYVDLLGFKQFGSNYNEYLMVEKDNIQIHFFLFKEIKLKENYSGVYIRTDDIDNLYRSIINNNGPIHPNGRLENKVWGQREFSMLDPDNNLLTFGQSLE